MEGWGREARITGSWDASASAAGIDLRLAGRTLPCWRALTASADTDSDD